MPAADEMALAKDALAAMQVRHKFIASLDLPRPEQISPWDLPDEPEPPEVAQEAPPC